MALETASYIANLITTNPDGSDQRSTADDHIRLIKAALRRTFPNLDSAVSLSAAQLAFSNDLSASVQFQLNQLRDGSATANNAINARFANSASLALFANSASFAALAATANSASYAALAGQATSASFATLAATANSASYAALAGTSGLANSASFAAQAGHAASASFAVLAATANSASYAAVAGNSDTVDGYHASFSASDAVVVRNSAGYIHARYLEQVSPDSEDPSVNQVMVTTGSDNFVRKSSLGNFGRHVETRNISSRTGTAKTLSTSAPSGGSNGDIWYRYS